MIKMKMVGTNLGANRPPNEITVCRGTPRWHVLDSVPESRRAENGCKVIMGNPFTSLPQVNFSLSRITYLQDSNPFRRALLLVGNKSGYL